MLTRSDDVRPYERFVSSETLETIRANEAEDGNYGLCTTRFRRLFNEIDERDAKIAELESAPRSMPPDCAVSLFRAFGHIPDELGGEKWSVFRDTVLIVTHPDRLIRIYRHGCKGAYVEIDPLPY